MNANVTSTSRPATKSNLMAAHHQWANRPLDERYWNLSDLWQTLQTRNAASAEKDMSTGELKAVVHAGEVCIEGKAGIPAKLTHWSFDQLARKIDAPAPYLRGKSPEMAAMNINDDMKKSANAPAQLLMHRETGGMATVRAITTDYSRLWNGQIVNALMKNGLQSGWMTPPARPVIEDPRARPATAEDIIPNQDDFGLAVKVGDMIAPAGVYEGDRDMFLFLVNPSRIIDDGGKGLMRGVFVWNSEVGAGAFSVRMFMLENICSNHIVWGASKTVNIRIIHRGENIKKFATPLLRALEAAKPNDLTNEVKMIATAKNRILGKDKEEVVNTIYNRKAFNISKRDVEAGYDWAVRWEHTARSAPNTAWGFVHGLTRYSQTMKFTDERDTLDTIGGKILDWATAG